MHAVIHPTSASKYSKKPSKFYPCDGILLSALPGWVSEKQNSRRTGAYAQAHPLIQSGTDSHPRLTDIPKVHPILWLVALIGLILLFARINRMPKAARSRFANRAIFVIAIGLGVFLLVRGLPPLLALLGALLPLLPRIMTALRTVETLKSLLGFVQQGLGKGTSKLETRWLRIELHRGRGEMEGEVLAGRYQGKRLSELTLEELRQVLAECHEQDRASIAILETYIEHRSGSGSWRGGYSRDRSGKGQGVPPKTESITIADAYKILGLPAGSSRKDVISAYRRLIQKLHPDRGGSPLLATQINKAKDLLLNYLPKDKE
uniref:DnaJ domain-containing protein n=1 Tax=Candidatus Kentrum sp. UNK TaxID=2126344 RepID=A0A451A6K1_9GAMM|nr:MAG: DnaJ domain-containing protein [Candidatus Kentron sp. UNK]VFK70439.1 MAG: DnaJ domain-containing protein [Candidatus Kentron sp. UNK]